MTTDDSRPGQDPHRSTPQDEGDKPTQHKAARSAVLGAPLLLAVIGLAAVCLALILI